MASTQPKNKFTKAQIERAWIRYGSPVWIHEQSGAFLELECIKARDFPVAMSISEISEKTGLSIASVREELQSAYKKLKTQLSEYERK